MAIRRRRPLSAIQNDMRCWRASPAAVALGPWALAPILDAPRPLQLSPGDG
jgi:hypothetical protein